MVDGMANTKDVLRRCRFTPYRKGMGPTFALVMWATPRTDDRGQTVIGYRLTQREPGKRPLVLFEGEDFTGSPMHADDSDATVASLMNFLTLRPGDTDSDYFGGYTPDQLDYCVQHAEALALCCYDRFGDL